MCVVSVRSVAIRLWLYICFKDVSVDVMEVEVGASKGLHGLKFDTTITYWSKFFVTSMIAQQAWSPCTSGSGTLVNVADYLTMIEFHDVNDENF
ncbi:hypothetical protein RYX36_013778 [Vicia faba]